MINEFILNNLREMREDKNLLQKDVAKILNTSRPNYTRWETKAKIIPLTKLNELCNYFNVNMDYILGLTNQKVDMRNDNVLDRKLIGQNIRNFRHENHLSQVELAKLLNTSHSVISAYENGKTLILTAFALEICQKYNISLDKLCNRK